MGNITATSPLYESDGSYGRVDCNFAFSNSYNNTGVEATTGETFTAASVGLSQIIGIDMPSEDSGYAFDVLGLASGPATSVRIQVFQGPAAGTTGNENAHTHAVALDSGTSGAGSAHTHVFTGTSTGSLDLATPAFSGTGLTAVGQVITTTDNQTMGLNECAGMWLISATQATPPNLILSNTAVVAAPAVFTVQGSANTDAGAYKVVKNIVPTGTNANESAHTHGPGTLADASSGAGSAHNHTTGAGAGSEVPNGTNLSVVLASVRVTVYGK